MGFDCTVHHLGKGSFLQQCPKQTKIKSNAHKHKNPTNILATTKPTIFPSKTNAKNHQKTTTPDSNSTQSTKTRQISACSNQTPAKQKAKQATVKKTHIASLPNLVYPFSHCSQPPLCRQRIKDLELVSVHFPVSKSVKRKKKNKKTNKH